MKCQYQEIRRLADDLREYRCQGCGHVRASTFPPEQLHRRCGSPVNSPRVDAGLSANLIGIQANGPTRTAPEVLVIITNFCTSCPAWNPAAEKKKCKYCGCGSSDTVENLHKRRIRNCPKGHWTEASLQAYLCNHAENL